MVVLVVVPVRQATIKQGFKKGSPRKRFWPQDWESFENCILPSGSFFRKMIMVEPLLQVVWYTYVMAVVSPKIRVIGFMEKDERDRLSLSDYGISVRYGASSRRETRTYFTINYQRDL